MTLEQLHTEWEKDAKLSLDALDEDARNVPIIHARWWRYYTTERLRYKQLNFEYKTLYRQRWEYWNGKLDDTERLSLGWSAQPLKILSQNLPVYLESDAVLQDGERKLAIATEKLKFLEDVIKSINNRNFSISSAINFLKWKSGV